ncbi:MAG: glycosyltransferase [Cytophagales bacterium]
MFKEPLQLSIVCICYNQSSYIQKCIETVMDLKCTFELIVCDDASTDGSVQIINDLSLKYNFKTILNKTNTGNCILFNKALKECIGKYVIDLAADDYVLPEILTERLTALENSNLKHGFSYSDAHYVNEKGDFLFLHSQLIKNYNPPIGNIYEKLFDYRFICPPTVIFVTKVLKEISGYDENLSYEDFDIWTRLAKNNQVTYFSQPTIAKRVVTNSSAVKFYGKNSKHLYSTFVICLKNNTYFQNNPLKGFENFVFYHFKISVLTANFEVAELFLNEFKFIKKKYILYFILKHLLTYKIDLSKIYKLYLAFRLKDLKIK